MAARSKELTLAAVRALIQTLLGKPELGEADLLAVEKRINGGAFKDPPPRKPKPPTTTEIKNKVKDKIVQLSMTGDEVRDLCTAQETARILGKRIDSLYNIVAAFDAKGDGEWELVEGKHVAYAGPALTGADGRRPRRFREEAWRPRPATSKPPRKRACLARSANDCSTCSLNHPKSLRTIKHEFDLGPFFG